MKPWMTQLLFQDALLNCYDSKMEKYCLEINNFQDFAPFVGDLHPDIKVGFSLHTPPL
jgi:hypothetical protein